MIVWSLLIFGVILLLIRTQIGNKLVVLIVLGILVLLIISIFTPEKNNDLPEKFVTANNITISKRTPQKDGAGGFPWFGSNTDSFYVIFPVNYSSIDRNNNCPDFNQYDTATWCGKDVAPKCYPGTTKENCGYINF